MAIVVHMRASVTEKLPYGRDVALVFLNELLPSAPDVPIQIAHLAGAGGYSDPLVDEALQVFVEAIQRKDIRTRNVWFDISGVTAGNLTADRAKLIATRIQTPSVDRRRISCDCDEYRAVLAMTTAFNKSPRVALRVDV